MRHLSGILLILVLAVASDGHRGDSGAEWPFGLPSIQGGHGGDHSSKFSFSSLVTVDPTRILPLLVDKGGLLLAEKTDAQLKQVSKLLHCDHAQLNVYDRAVLIRNFTVSLPDAPHPALRVGRISVKWDSYAAPCLEIEVEDIDVRIEFANLFLTKTNWHELNEAGFPPEISGNSSDVEANTRNNSFVHVRSLDVLGNVVLRTHSRPLNKELSPDIVVSLAMMQELNDQVKTLAEQKRVGCTPDEVYMLYSQFFSEKAKAAVKATLEDIVRGQLDPSKEIVTVVEAQKLLSSARDTFLSYAEGVSKLSKDKIKRNLKKGILQVIGEDKDDAIDRHVDSIVSNTLGALKTTINNQGTTARLEKIRNFWKLGKDSDSKGDTGFDDDIIFADW